jgi:hypothetical protein
LLDRIELWGLGLRARVPLETRVPQSISHGDEDLSRSRGRPPETSAVETALRSDPQPHASCLTWRNR